jgi:4-aminobutyrate---pyruvate transaminase
LPGESEEAFVARCVRSLEDLIEREGAETIGAFFAEPIMVSGGCIVPPPTYYEKIQAVLKKHDILLIADEVICGFGRTGAMFGCETFGIEPDMITMAKQLSASYQPISALMINEKIYRAIVSESATIGTFGHGFTYGGHPVPAAVALETLKIYEERDIVGHVRRVARTFEDGLKKLGQHPMVGEARGKGMVGALELVEDKATRKSFDPAVGVAAYVGQRAQAHGVLTRCLGDNVNLCPPLIITEAQIAELLGRIKLALDDTLKWVEGQMQSP